MERLTTSISCKSCSFFEASVRTGLGECRKAPPENSLVLWPTVSENDWCGQYFFRTEKQEHRECSKCRFLFFDKNTAVSLCRVDPPRIATKNSTMAWPIVKKDYWCSLFTSCHVVPRSNFQSVSPTKKQQK